MAEKQSDHRREMEKKIIESEIRLSMRGQVFAFSIAVLAMLATVTFAYLGQVVTATVIGGATIVTLVTLFIRGKPKKEKAGEDHISDERSSSPENQE